MKKHDPFNKGLPPPKVAEPKAKRVPRSWEQATSTGRASIPTQGPTAASAARVAGARGEAAMSAGVSRLGSEKVSLLFALVRRSTGSRPARSVGWHPRWQPQTKALIQCTNESPTRAGRLPFRRCLWRGPADCRQREHVPAADPVRQGARAGRGFVEALAGAARCADLQGEQRRLRGRQLARHCRAAWAHAGTWPPG